MLRLFFADKKDVYLASDLIVYYEEGNPNRRFAPDLMICFGTQNKKRRTYKLWEEKIVPQFIIEVVFKETWEKDVTTNFSIPRRKSFCQQWKICGCKTEDLQNRIKQMEAEIARLKETKN